jgi:enoyl-CoA hydratase
VNDLGVTLSGGGRVATVRLNWPKALNALNSGVMRAMAATTGSLNSDVGVGAIVIIGSEKAFAAGADIKETAERSAVEMLTTDWFSGWDAVAECRTPLIAPSPASCLEGGASS